MRFKAWPLLFVIVGSCAESGVSISLEDASMPNDSGASILVDSGKVSTDTGAVDATTSDTGGIDAAATPDSGFEDARVLDSGAIDAGTEVPDSGVGTDAEPARDAGIDAGFSADASTLILNPSPLTATLGSPATIFVSSPVPTGVIWSIDGVVGGTAGTGTVTAQPDQRSAVYFAPRQPSQRPPGTSRIQANVLGQLVEADIILEYPQPTITSASPTFLPAGGPTSQLTIRGTGFTPETVVTLGGSVLTTLNQTWTELTVEVEEFVLLLPGERELRISNPIPGGGSATLMYSVTVYERVVPTDVSTSAPSLFASATPSANPAMQPSITYPAHNSVTPRDFPEPTISWTQSTGVNVCRVALNSAGVDVELFTRSDAAVYGPWENPYILIEPRIWQMITYAFRDFDVEIEVACGEIVSTNGVDSLVNNEIGISSPITYRVSSQTAGGRVVYFSGYENGLVRIDIGGSAFTRINWLGPTGAFDTQTPKCVGCHSFSQDGRSMAYSSFDAEFGISSVNNGMLTSVLPLTNPQSSEWSAIHPNGNYLATIDSNYGLNLYDATNGSLISAIDTSGFADLVTQPFWSPQGDKLSFVTSSTAGAEGVLSVEEGEIWTLDFTFTSSAASFSNPQRIVSASSIGGNVFYPSFSPDGEWIAYCQATGGESYHNETSELWLIKTDGSVGPIRLDLANQGPNLYNSWPRWAPTFAQDKYWLVFSSEREYGPFIGSGPQQLWVTLIDVSNLPNDPSNPAIWLPGQFEFSGNLTAEWSLSR